MAAKKQKSKKAAKKTVRKTAKKAGVKKATKQRSKKANVKKSKPLGVVTHYYSGIEVGIVKCAAPIKIGDMVHVKGATTDFVQAVDSLQYDRTPLSVSKKGQEVGMKVKDRVREGDEVYAVK